MMRNAHVWVLLTAAAAALAGPAQEEPPALSLDACVRLGLQQSARAVNARHDEELAGARVREARGEALPWVSGEATYTRLDEVQAISFGDESIEAGVEDNYSVSLRVEQLLYSGGRVGAALRAARLARELARYTREEVESELARDIRLAFYGALLARRAVEVGEASVAQLAEHLEQVRQKRAQQAASEFDELSARVRLANEEHVLIAARNRYALSMGALKRLLGMDEGLLQLEGSLEPSGARPSLETLLQVAEYRRPALRGADTIIQLREEDRRAARSGTLPSLRARWVYTGANAFQFAPFGDEWQWHWTAGLVLEWPLWDGGTTAARVSQKRIEVRKSRTEREDLLRAVRLDVEQGFLDLEAAGEAIRAARGSVALAEKALEIAWTRQETGLGTQLEFAEANVALGTARLGWYRALHDEAAALARLRHACGLENDAWQAVLRRGVEAPGARKETE
jgi:HAE1 family hydrophobic/amphiphilic exporter-1